MWLNCIKNITPFIQLKELFEFLSESFKRNGITEPDNIYDLVQIVALLEISSNDEYIDCPKMPEWHLENADDDVCEPEAYLADIYRYYWFDFNILDRDRNILPLRAVFNRGYADYNDGIWGVAWDRNTGREVAHFRNIGGDTGETEVISQQHIDSYHPHNLCFPDQFGSSIRRNINLSKREDWTEPLDIEFQSPYTIYFARSLELETLIGLTLRWSADYTFYHFSDGLMVIAYKNFMARVSKEKLCREQFGELAEKCFEQAELLGSLCLVRDYDIEARFENILCGDSLKKVYFFSKRPEASLSTDNITNARWKFLFYFARDYLIKQGYDMEYSLSLEEECGKYSDEVKAFSDKVTYYSRSYRKRFDTINKFAVWFEYNCCGIDFDETGWGINNENIYIFFNSLSAKLNSSGHPISVYELNDGDRNENYKHTVYAIIGTSCLILVVKEWAL